MILDPAVVRDFTWTWHNDILISPKVLGLFKRYRVTGFEIDKPRVSYPEGIKSRPPDLFEVVVTGCAGWGAPAAGVALAWSCPVCGAKDYVIAEPSRLINAASWDGGDLFVVWPLPKFPFASNRLAIILRREKISGVQLTPARKIPVKRETKVSITEDLMDARSLFLTANTTTVYVLSCIDLKDGPMVVQVPRKVLGAADDAFFRWVTDVGLTGPDQGRGGKYLFMPPGYQGSLPSDGYFVAKPRSNKVLIFSRAFVEGGNIAAAVNRRLSRFD